MATLAANTVAMLALASPAAANPLGFSQKFLAPDGASHDRFGGSVALDGNYALIGAIGDDDKGSGSGSAYLLDITTGDLIQKLTAPDGASSYRFGASVALDGDYALIGSGSAANSGSAYLFDLTTGNLLHKLIAPDGARYDVFGRSVAIDGDYALIGASGDDDKGRDSGSAYLFDLTTGNLLHKLIAPDGASYDGFGRSLAIDGNYALIASPYDDDKGASSGSTYLFDITTGNLLHKLIAPDGASGNIFGDSVALDGNYALIGSSTDYNNGTWSGSAYLFDISSGSLLQKLIAPDGVSGDLFGSSVAIDGDYALVGAKWDWHDEYYNDLESGSAYLFDITTGNLIQKIIAPDSANEHEFGSSVALDGHSILIGAHGDDDKGLYSGSAYLFAVQKQVPEPSAVLGLIAVGAWAACKRFSVQQKQ